MSLSSCHSTGPVFGGDSVPTHLQVRNAESFSYILNTSTRVDTSSKVFPSLKYRKSFTVNNSQTCSQPYDRIELPHLYQYPWGSLSCCHSPLARSPLWVHRCPGPGPLRTGTHLRAMPWAGALLHSSLLRIPSAKRCRSVQTILQQRIETVLQTPPHTPGTCLAVSLANSAFLQHVPRSQAHGLQAMRAFLLSVLVDYPVSPLARQCKNTLHSHYCVTNKGGSCINSCGGCLIPVASFNAIPLFHSSSQFSTVLSLY